MVLIDNDSDSGKHHCIGLPLLLVSRLLNNYCLLLCLVLWEALEPASPYLCPSLNNE